MATSWPVQYHEQQDVRIAYYDEGTGPPIILLHGFPLNKSMWDAQVAALMTSYRVIVPDLRGHGGSSVTRGKVSMATMAADIVVLLNALDLQEQVTVAGLSMGGYVAWELWRSVPDRLRRFVLCDTRAAADSETVARGREWMAAEVERDGVGSVAETMIPKLLSATSVDAHAPTVDAMIRGTDPAAVAATQRGMAERRDAEPLLAEIKIPALLLAGSEDAISPPAEMRAIASQLPHGTFIEIPAAGHLAPLEQPHACNQAIEEFLANT